MGGDCNRGGAGVQPLSSRDPQREKLSARPSAQRLEVLLYLAVVLMAECSERKIAASSPGPSRPFGLWQPGELGTG